MEIGVFIPIGSNGWIVSTTSPQYNPSFELNKQTTLNAERYGFDFALSMIKLRGFGGESGFWDQNLESFTLMAGLAAVTSRIKLYATVPTLAIPPAIAARMAVTIDSISSGRFGLNVITGWQRPEYAQMGLWPGDEYFAQALRLRRRIRAGHAASCGTTGVSNFKGEYFKMDDCRLQPKPQAPIKLISAGQSDAGMEFIAKYADYNFVLRHGLQHADRLRAHRRAPAEGRRQQRPQGRDLRPVHDHRRRDRRRGAGQVGPLQERRRPRGAEVADPAELGRHQVGPRHQRAPHVVRGRATSTSTSACLCGSYASVASMMDEIDDHPGHRRRAADLRRVRERHQDLRRAHPAADEDAASMSLPIV